jgi:hypothetical protein
MVDGALQSWAMAAEHAHHLCCSSGEQINTSGTPWAFVRPKREGTGSVCCRSIGVLHLRHFLNQEELMEREAMVQNP